MPVSISRIFDIKGRVVAPVSLGVSLDVCAFSKNSSLPASCVMMFTDYQDVLSFFGDSTLPECTNALIYFNGYNGSVKIPNKLLMTRWVDETIPALMISQALPSLSEIKDSANAETVFNITKLDGTLTDISIDNFVLSTVTSYTNLASSLETAINTEAGEDIITITYNSGNNSFTYNTVLKGDTAQILATTYPEGGTGADLGSILGTNTPAFVSAGEATRTVDENISHVLNCVSDFAGFVSFFPMLETTSLSVATYLNGIEDDFCFFAQTNNTASLNSGDTTALKAQVSALKNVYVQWGTVANTVFSSAIGACVDYENGIALNWAFKSQTGLVADVTTDSVYDALTENGYNFYATYGLKATSDNFLMNGNVTGIYNFVDSLYNSIWLKDSLQRDLLLLFTNVGQIGYNIQGYSLIKSALQNTINLALNNNVISTGITLSTAQIIQLSQELGEDVSATLESNGYILIVDDPGAQARITRQSPICKLIYTYSGGINKIVLESIQVQ